ncbi:ATP-binding protein [Actinomadura syzygii]|uniref:NB-ARC domain-containing protein n=1 Tax=Actinomadura syzygii TaxID=1427538 RepID=A0A5D0U0C7_9ACTN|nr:hypothetical protein [Actinomadura syzygii]TYC11213.1 hypothetical protein FXF65_30205 [Actinomadura syzygii]
MVMEVSPNDPPGNLPRGLPTFVGRTLDLLEIGRLLSEHRLVTVTGVAGVGKTRTALRTGEDLAGRFPDGVWLIPLSQLSDPANVPNAVALEMKVRDQTARPMIDLLAAHLAGRSCLIILDTCEHLLEGCAFVARELLAASPQTRILATSREPLFIADEVIFELEPMPTPAEQGGRTGGDSVRLFAERARQCVPEFTVTQDNAEAVGALCDRLDGLPLALELAAAQLLHRTVEDLADRPDPRAVPPEAKAETMSEVVIEAMSPRTALAAHGGLWTAIGWSHELCTPAERLLWARASVFAGPFTRKAAEEVCGGGPLTNLDDVLERLVDQSVLILRGDSYRLLDALREYGAFWLAELGEDDDLRARHRDRYLAIARRAFPEWTRQGQVGWYQLLADEFAEVRKAMRTCLDEPGPSALELAGALWFFWISCDFEREGREFLERALNHHTVPGPLRVRAAWALGCVMNFQGDLDGIQMCIAECRSAAPDPTAVRAADYIEATDWAMGGKPEQALERLVHLVSAAWEDSVQEAVWMLSKAALAFARVAMGDYPAATELADDLREDGTRRGELKFRCWGHYIHALIALFTKDHAAAAEHAGVAFDGSRQLNDASNMALSLEVVAIANHAQGAPERAAVLLGTSTRLWSHDGGRDRFTVPQLAVARQECERSIADAIGKDALNTLFTTGLHATWP